MSEPNPLQELINKLLRKNIILYIVFVCTMLVVFTKFYDETLRPVLAGVQSLFEPKAPKLIREQIDNAFNDLELQKHLDYRATGFPVTYYQETIMDSLSQAYGPLDRAPYSLVQNMLGHYIDFGIEINNIQPYEPITEQYKASLLRYAALNKKILTLQLIIISDGLTENRLTQRTVLRSQIEGNLDEQDEITGRYGVYFMAMMVRIFKKYNQHSEKTYTIAEKELAADYYRKKWMNYLLKKTGKKYEDMLSEKAKAIGTGQICQWLEI